MIIAYDSVHLRAICEDVEEAQKQVGEDAARGLRDRLADLRAALSWTDLIAGSPTVEGGQGERLALALKPDYVLLLEANHRRQPLNDSGTVDWSRVRYVKIVEVAKR